MKYRIRLYLYLLIFSYLILIKSGLGGISQPFRILICFVLIIDILVYLLNKSKAVLIPSYTFGFFLIYFVLVALYFYENILFNLGTCIKYILYILVFIAAYNGLNVDWKRIFNNYFFIFLYAISFYQLFTGDTQFINMVHRVSGPYYLHSSGFALFLTVLMGYVLYGYNEATKNYIKYSHLILLLILILNTGSRSSLIGILFAVLFVEIFLRKNYRMIILIFLLIPLSFLGFYNFILHNDVFIRFAYLIQNGADASTLTRLKYFENAISNMPINFFGNGLGSFANLYEILHGKRLGAHNNLLLFLVELGYFGVFIYLLHVILVGFKVIEKNKYFLAFMFFSFYIGGSLNNNYYYPVGMIIFFFELGKSLKKFGTNTTSIIS